MMQQSDESDMTQATVTPAMQWEKKKLKAEVEDDRK